MVLRSRLADVRRRLLCSLHPRLVSLRSTGPLVSFCFDDFPRTAYDVGGAILKGFGARGTFYVAMGLMNTNNELGEQFSRVDLESLVAEGHELACHTFSHISCRAVSVEVFENDVRKGREAIREATGCDPANFAYPYGHVTLAAKKKIGGQMKSCRSIYGGVNGPTADLNLLRANSVYGDVDGFGQLDALLSENEERRGWLVLYTHDVRANPSPFGCTPALFEKVVRRAKAKGARIVPVQEVVDSAQAVLDGSRSPIRN